MTQLQANTVPNGDGALIPDLGSAKYMTDEAFDQIALAGAYLPRLQLFGGNSDAAKEGKIPIAHYGLVRAKDQIDDMGVSVDVIPVSVRFAAMRLEEGNVASFHNPDSEAFRQVMIDSEEPNSRCMYGCEAA